MSQPDPVKVGQYYIAPYKGTRYENLFMITDIPKHGLFFEVSNLGLGYLSQVSSLASCTRIPPSMAKRIIAAGQKRSALKNERQHRI